MWNTIQQRISEYLDYINITNRYKTQQFFTILNMLKSFINVIFTLETSLEKN